MMEDGLNGVMDGGLRGVTCAFSEYVGDYGLNAGVYLVGSF